MAQQSDSLKKLTDWMEAVPNAQKVGKWVRGALTTKGSGDDEAARKYMDAAAPRRASIEDRKLGGKKKGAAKRGQKSAARKRG
jgi:hypothetical protein